MVHIRCPAESCLPTAPVGEGSVETYLILGVGAGKSSGGACAAEATSLEIVGLLIAHCDPFLPSASLFHLFSAAAFKPGPHVLSLSVSIPSFSGSGKVLH